MRTFRLLPFFMLAALLATTFPLSAGAAGQVWQVTGGTVTLSLSSDHLSNLGLTVAGSRATSDRYGPRELTLEPPLYSFEAAPGLEAEFRTINGSFDGFRGDRIVVPVRGGLAFQARHPRTGETLAPTFLYDFSVSVGASLGDLIRIRTADPVLPVPIAVRNVGARFDAETQELVFPMGDIVFTDEWARRLGQPELAGQWIGAFDLRFRAELIRGEATAPETPSPDRGAVLDVLLGELYGLVSQGHVGTYPNGRAGLSAATTSCNNGNVNVPWNAPMAETHPFIGLALFRMKDGVLEMLGKNYMKHGWFALSNDQCNLGCVGGGGSFLAVGCSDTYSASNNGSRFYLGPRSEINPYTGAWEACGSFFDGTPVDCQRSYMGSAPDDVWHRLEVYDEDLGDPQATYYYEGCYYVADDDTLSNNIGWREVQSMTWTGSNWSISTVGGGVAPNPGAVIRLFGTNDTQPVATGDGDAVLAVKTTDLGNGTWHYEYALYNRHSDRGLYSFSIPVGDANVTNIGFHDLDKDSGNDWAATNVGGVLTWATDDYATDPNAPYLDFQTMFNFRFDADTPPTAATGLAGIFKPGPGTTVAFDTEGPLTSITSVTGGRDGLADFGLSLVGPNPFSEQARLAFSVPQKGPVRLAVLDVAGRTVQTLLDGSVPSGRSVVAWNGRDATGARVASGVYFFRLDTEGRTRTIKGTFVR